MDQLDRNILEILQQDCAASISTLAEGVGLGTTACWRRVHRLESEGIIRKRVALLDAHSINACQVLLVMVRLNRAQGEEVNEFLMAAMAMSEVTQLYRLQDSACYAMTVQVANMHAFDALARQLEAFKPVASMRVQVVMETLKQTSALPLSGLRLAG